MRLPLRQDILAGQDSLLLGTARIENGECLDHWYVWKNASDGCAMKHGRGDATLCGVEFGEARRWLLFQRKVSFAREIILDGSIFHRINTKSLHLVKVPRIERDCHVFYSALCAALLYEINSLKFLSRAFRFSPQRPFEKVL